MVDVSKPEGIAPVGAADRRPRDPRRDLRHDLEDEEPPTRRHAPRPRETIGDVAFILGVPNDELTPKVSQALMTIMTEFDRQRHELEHLRDHAAYLERQADRHDLLPVYNRRALMREMARIIAHAEKTGMASTLLWLRIDDLEQVRARRGREAAAGVGSQVAEMGKAGLRGADVIGSMGGGDLGIVLALADAAGGEAKAHEVTERIAQRTFAVKGHELRVQPVAGLYELRPGDTPEEALDAAEHDLHRAHHGRESEGDAPGG
ncbi:MAG: diguanylate cyclase [Rhodobacterales bacterium]|nr:diguanylate cyclase [Rhodobacterales bacterium]